MPYPIPVTSFIVAKSDAIGEALLERASRIAP